MKPYHMTIDNDWIEIHAFTDNGRKRKVVVNSVLDYHCFFLAEAKKYNCDIDSLPPLMCSSSMDFPEDSTKSKTVIELANVIRSGELSETAQKEMKKMGRGRALSPKHRAQLRLIRDNLLKKRAAAALELNELEQRLTEIVAQLEGK